MPVAVVLDNLAAGISAEELHADCPTLSFDRGFANVMQHPPGATAGGQTEGAFARGARLTASA